MMLKQKFEEYIAQYGDKFLEDVIFITDMDSNILYNGNAKWAPPELLYRDLGASGWMRDVEIFKVI